MTARMAPEGGRAIVSLNGDIGRWGFSPEAWDGIESWCQENSVARVTMRINSPGGNLADAMSIIDRMQASGLELEAEVFGLCASAATLVALACKRVRMSWHSHFMVHHPFGIIAGTLEDMETGLEVFKTYRAQAFAMYAEKTGKPAEQIMEEHAHDVWYSAEQAVAYGFVDEIIGAAAEEDEPEEEEPVEDETSATAMYANRGLLGSAALAKLMSWCGIRPSARKQEDDRVAALQARVDSLQADMVALKAERDGAAATAAAAEAEAQLCEERIRERVAAAVAEDRARMAVTPATLPAPELAREGCASLAGLSTNDLLARAAAERGR